MASFEKRREIGKRKMEKKREIQGKEQGRGR
jgi:hypothetical protein